MVGNTEQEATFTLEQAGFQVQITTKEDESVDEGTVLQQDPAGGTKQQKGATHHPHHCRGARYRGRAQLQEHDHG